MKKLILLFAVVFAFCACVDESTNYVVASITIQNSNQTDSGRRYASTEYLVLGTSGNGETFTVSGTLSTPGQQVVFLENDKLEKGSLLSIYANGSQIHSRTADSSFVLIYYDELAPFEDRYAVY